MEYYNNVKVMEEDLVKYLHEVNVDKEVISTLDVIYYREDECSVTIENQGDRYESPYISLSSTPVEDVKECIRRFVDFELYNKVDKDSTVLVIHADVEEVQFHPYGVLCLPNMDTGIYRLDHSPGEVIVYLAQHTGESEIEKISIKYTTGKSSGKKQPLPVWLDSIDNVNQMINSPVNAGLAEHITLIDRKDVFSGNYIWSSQYYDHLCVKIPVVGWILVNRDWFLDNFNNFPKEIIEECTLLKEAGA